MNKIQSPFSPRRGRQLQTTSVSKFTRTFVCIISFLVLAASKTSLVSAENIIPQEEIEACDASQSCQECLETSVCDWYGPRSCSHSSMVIMDIARYSLQDNESSSVDEICQRAALDQADSSLCRGQTDCASCTESVLSDGVSTCSWFAEFEFCSSNACTMMGCGESSCPSVATTEPPVVAVDKANETTTSTPPVVVDNSTTTPDCSSKTTCEECAATGGNGEAFCAWVPVFFYEHYPCTSMSCDTVADPNCYSRERDDRPASEICAQANDYYEAADNNSNDEEASANNVSGAVASLQRERSIGFVVAVVFSLVVSAVL